MNYFNVFTKCIQDSYYVYAFEQRLIWIWSKDDGVLKAQLEVHESIVRDIDINIKENRLLSASFDKTIKLFSPTRLEN